MNWGIKIVISFVCFVGLLVTLVYVSVSTDFYLVADNYYEQELAYESQIQRIKNVNGLAEKPDFKLVRSERKAELRFPLSVMKAMEEGKISFFRSANARLDKEFDLVFDETGLQTFDMKSLASGAWKVKIEWKSKGTEYYQELNIVL
ncbi:FixH family protein [uncultured Roseivirga sp.]|uniref:FixH family protein n=1 Tax=uncultured Roseivirga sp. TaxID=543088 RepID=UPI0030D86F0A|tara:strand:- start:113764 stop:114204 length:441 start_codon:yes stop_codon:yes gene_type:complete